MNILDYFPAGLTPRPEQAAMLMELAQNWMHYDVFAITAPTGTGKTELALTISRWQEALGFGTNIVMPNNGLVTQTLQRYPDTPVLHKQADYTCESFGDCKSGRTAQQHACKGCPYVKAKAKITRSKVRLMNYHIYWAHKLYAPNLVVDECFPSDAVLQTDSGPRRIGAIYRMWQDGQEVRVLSRSASGEFEYQKVTYGWKRPGKEKTMLEVSFGNSLIRCTDNHKLLTTRGWVSAGDLVAGDCIIGPPSKTSVRAHMNDARYQIILGSWLGDGSLDQRADCFRMKLVHGDKQKEYLEAKRRVLGAPVPYRGKSGYCDNIVWATTTPMWVGVLKWEDMLQHINALGLAVWFLDDGTYFEKKQYITIATNSFSKSQVESLSSMLLSRFGVESRVYESKGYWNLRINKDATSKFLDLIRPYVPACMSYKCPGAIGESWPEITPEDHGYIVRNVKQIESVEWVYDLEVEKNHNFVVRFNNIKASKNWGGVVAHNCHKLLDLFSSTREHYIWHSKYKFPTEMRVVSDAVKWAQAEVKKRDDPKLETFLIELLRMNAETEVEYEEAIFRGKDDIKLKVYNVTNSGVPPWLWPPHRVRKIVLMSATIGMEDIKELGLDKRRIKLIECDSPIPPERRMLICDPYVTMRHDVMDHAIPRLVTKIRETLAKHPEKGLIHAPYALAEKIRAELDDPRLIFHTRANKAAKLAEFRRAPEGAVLVASGMYEGIDLPYDAARWQIISRVPYPSLGAVSVRMRKDINSDWYSWQAVKAIIQATGRITRAADDFGVTYIFDTNFVNLLQRDDKRDTPMFPRSNRAAIKVI